MSKYKGQIVHTITKADIGKRLIKASPCRTCGFIDSINTTALMGGIFACDVRKQIVKTSIGFRVESQEQMEKRLKK